jgi:WD40 repeat protein/uncharacterized caspase-like protein
MRPEIVVQSGHTLPIVDMSFSPDSRFVATASPDETVRIWDLRVGCEFRVLVGHQGPVYSVRYSPGGNCLVTGGYDRAPKVWDASSGALIRTLEPTRLPVSVLQFDRSGSRLISVSHAQREKGEVFVWNTSDWSLVRTFDLEYDRDQTSQCVTLHPDGSVLAVYHLKPAQVVLLDITDGQQKSSISLRKATQKLESMGSPGDLIYTASGKALVRSGNEAKASYLIPIGSPSKTTPIQSALNAVGELSLLPDGSIALFGPEGFERWNAEATKCLARGSGAMRALSPDGKLAATNKGRALVVSDVATGALVYELGERPLTPTQLGNLGRHYTVAANPVYPMIASSAPDGFIRLWDLRSGQGPAIFKASERGIENLAFSPNGKALAAASSPIRIWNPWSAKLIAEIATKSSPRYLAFSSSGSHLVAVGDRSLTVITAGEWTSTEIDLDLKHHVSGIVFEPGTDRFYLGSRAGEWVQLSIGDLHPKINIHRAPIGALANNAGLAVVYSQHKWIDGLMRSSGGGGEAAPQSVVSYLGERSSQPTVLLGGSPYVYAAAVSPNGASVVTACGDGEINVWDVSRPQQPHIWVAHPGAATSVAWTSDGRFLVSTGMDGAMRLWRAADHELAATVVSFSDTDYVIAAADGSYTATRGGLASVVFRVGDRAVPFDQFDLTLNRPDRVHNSLGYAYHDQIDSFHLAYQRRVRRMGVAAQETADEMQLPDVKMLSPAVPLASPARELSLRVEAVPTKSPLSQLLVYVNDVPYPNRRGFDLGNSAQPVEREISLPLSAGPNRIEIAALAANGAESLRQVIQTTQTGNAAAGTLFLLALGVSKYREESLSLHYAAKDAHDLANALRKRQKHFASVKVRLLTDGDATKDGIVGSRAFLEGTTVDDQVIIFFSGHGALFGYDYYFLPHDFDPTNPTSSGLPYDSIEGLLDGIAARNRLVLLDTCHAGEADFVAPEGTGPVASPAKGVKAFRHFGPARLKEQPHVAGVTDRTLAGLFADLRRGAGAFVIGAAGAAEFAVEREKFANGVFTYCILQSLEDSTADRNQDGVLRVSELHRYVSSRVAELTGGRQRPISRRENLRNDFAVI